MDEKTAVLEKAGGWVGVGVVVDQLKTGAGVLAAD